MKYVIFTILAINILPFHSLANETQMLTCTTYHLPTDCFYDHYDLRGWDCKNKNYPIDEGGTPYDSIKKLNLSVQNGHLTANEIVHNMNGTMSEKKLIDMDNLTCSFEFRSCETPDRKKGVYLVGLEDQDRIPYYSLQVRTEEKIQELTTAMYCE